MMKIKFTDYRTGRVFKTLTNASISFGPERVRGEERFVVREYRTGKVLRTIAMPARSCSYSAEELGSW